MAILRATHQKIAILRFQVAQKLHAELVVVAFRALPLFDLLLNLRPQLLHRPGIVGDDKTMAAVALERMNVAGSIRQITTEVGLDAGVQAYWAGDFINDGFNAFQGAHRPYLQNNSDSVESEAPHTPYILFLNKNSFVTIN